MRRTSLVVGIGNPLQGTDGFGPAVIDRLRRTRDLGDSIELVDACTDLLAHLDRFAAHECVVLVDAIVGAEGRGVALFDEETFSQWDERSPSCHALSPLLAVKLFRRLHPTSLTRIVLVGLSVDALGFGHSLAPEDVEAGVQAVIQLIETNR